MIAALDAQLNAQEADLLRVVLVDLVERVQQATGDDLLGIYLKGSFALGAADIYSDVDFLVVTGHELDSAAEQAVREVHRRLPDRPEHWAHVLEGSYASADQVRERADPNKPWLYVDNGQREMSRSAHDNSEVLRWVLKNRALPLFGPSAHSLLPDVPTQLLRDEAANQASLRHDDALIDPEYLENGWGQPHEVLTQCRMFYSASTGQVAAKEQAARWCLSSLPTAWHGVIEAAITDRPNPWQRIHRSADPDLTALTRGFIEEMKPRIVQASTGPLLGGWT